MAHEVECHPAAGRVIWARKPFHGRRGTYTAVRRRDGQLAVAIRRAGYLEWVPAAWALSDAGAGAWAETGSKGPQWAAPS